MVCTVCLSIFLRNWYMQHFLRVRPNWVQLIRKLEMAGIHRNVSYLALKPEYSGQTRSKWWHADTSAPYKIWYTCWLWRINGSLSYIRDNWNNQNHFSTTNWEMIKNANIFFCSQQGKSEGFVSCDRPIVRKRPIWVKICDVLYCVTLKFDGWPWKTIEHLSFAVSSFV